MLTELCFGTNKAMIKRKNKGKTMKILLAMTIKPPCFFMFYVFCYVFESPRSGYTERRVKMTVTIVTIVTNGASHLLYPMIVYLANFSRSCFVPTLRKSTVALVFSPVPSTLMTVPTPKR